MTIVVISNLHPLPGRLEATVEALKEIRDETLAEKGCVGYRILQNDGAVDADESGQSKGTGLANIVVISEFLNEDAFAIHYSTCASFIKYSEKSQAFVTGGSEMFTYNDPE